MASAMCAVYIITNQRRTVLYIGVTGDLRQRVAEHKMGAHPSSFTRRYNVDRLVYFEMTPNIAAAIAREKELKGWRRDRKVALIEKANPDWNDLGNDALAL